MNNNDRKIHNLKINRVTFFVSGLLFSILGIFIFPLLFIGIILLLLAFILNKEYKRLVKLKTEVKRKIEESEPVPETVTVTDIDGSVLELTPYQVISDEDKVLIAEGGRTYHRRLSCYKNWTGDAQRNFTGWKIINKSDAITQGMTYCKFCAENDNLTLDDLLDELDEDE